MHDPINPPWRAAELPSPAEGVHAPQILQDLKRHQRYYHLVQDFTWGMCEPGYMGSHPGQDFARELYAKDDLIIAPVVLWSRFLPGVH